MICDECKEKVEKCFECNKKFSTGSEVICIEDFGGNVHVCSDGCKDRFVDSYFDIVKTRVVEYEQDT